MYLITNSGKPRTFLFLKRLLISLELESADTIAEHVLKERLMLSARLHI